MERDLRVWLVEVVGVDEEGGGRGEEGVEGCGEGGFAGGGGAGEGEEDGVMVVGRRGEGDGGCGSCCGGWGRWRRRTRRRGDGRVFEGGHGGRRVRVMESSLVDAIKVEFKKEKTNEMIRL